MYLERLPSGVSKFENLPVNEKLECNRIVDRELIIRDELPQTPPVRISQPGQVAIPKLLNRRADMARWIDLGCLGMRLPPLSWLR